MNKTYTATLSSKELEFIEKLMAKYGNVVDFNMVAKTFGIQRERQELKNFILNLTKKGWLVRLKRGLFVISDISDRGSINLSQITIAQLIDNEAYVSFEAALQHHGLFDQHLRTITLVSKKGSNLKTLFSYNYKYIKVKKELFKDFNKYSIDGQLVKIASKEKAIIDFLIYRRTRHSIDLVIEKLTDKQDQFDVQKLISVSGECSITVKRTLGVILDKLNIDSSSLYKMIKNNKNHSFATKDSKKFNAKWRLYVYDSF